MEASALRTFEIREELASESGEAAIRISEKGGQRDASRLAKAFSHYTDH